MLADEMHENPMGTMHGGIVATLVDTAMGCALSSLLPADSGFTTLELKTNFVRAITQATGRVYAEGTVVHSGGRVAMTEARVRDDSGALYAARDIHLLDSERCAMNQYRTTMRVGDQMLTVREISLDDVDRLQRMFARLSPDTVYHRFFSPIVEPRRSALVWLTAVDHTSRDALVALDGDEIVAVARYDGRPGRGHRRGRGDGRGRLAAPGHRPAPHGAVGAAGHRPGHRVVHRVGDGRQPARARPPAQTLARRVGAVRGRGLRSLDAAPARELTTRSRVAARMSAR